MAKIAHCIVKYCRRRLPPRLHPHTICEDCWFLDDDVSKEKRRIDEMSPKHKARYNLLLQNLSKFYGPFLPVNQISIGIKK